jgi:hypothetical protein
VDPGGLRRGTVHNAILRWCSGKTTTVGGIEDILVEIGDDQVETIKRFLKWVTYCYQYNQGRMLDLRPGLLSVDEIDHEFVRRVAYLNEDLSGSMITETFRFPSAEAILTVDPDKILDMRNKGGGLEYFHAVERGQEKPSETSACLVLDALEKYTGDITKLFISEGRHILNWEVYLKACCQTERLGHWENSCLILLKKLCPHRDSH